MSASRDSTHGAALTTGLERCCKERPASVIDVFDKMDMHPVFRFMLAALAAWRLSLLLAREEGPWRVFARLRLRYGDGPMGRVLSCVKCAGVWISIPFAAFVGGYWHQMIVVWLALAGVVALFDEWTKPPFEIRGEE
jgi:hypothetical protein